MTRKSLARIAIALLAALLIAPAALGAPTAGRTDAGLPYAMGGTSVEDLQALERHKADFSLWVTTAARGTGAYLADVQVKITDARKQLVFNETLTGPWLFIQLPAGRYTVEAAFRGVPQARTTQVPASGQRQLMFYFDCPVERSPEWHSPFAGNPYDCD